MENSFNDDNRFGSDLNHSSGNNYNSDILVRIAELESLATRLSVQLGNASLEITRLRNYQVSSFCSKHRQISKYCNTPPRGCPKREMETYETTREHWLRLYGTSEYLDSLETEISCIMGGLPDILRSNLLFSDMEIRIILLDICGFNYRSIGIILGLNCKTVSSKKVKLRQRIMQFEENVVCMCLNLIPMMSNGN